MIHVNLDLADFDKQTLGSVVTGSKQWQESFFPLQQRFQPVRCSFLGLAREFATHFVSPGGGTFCHIRAHK